MFILGTEQLIILTFQMICIRKMTELKTITEFLDYDFTEMTVWLCDFLNQCLALCIGEDDAYTRQDLTFPGK